MRLINYMNECSNIWSLKICLSENRYSVVQVQFRGYGAAEKQRFKFHVISLIRECNSDVP